MFFYLATRGLHERARIFRLVSAKILNSGQAKSKKKETSAKTILVLLYRRKAVLTFKGMKLFAFYL